MSDGKSELADLLKDVPKTVAWAEIPDFDRMDERRMCVEMISGVIIGVLDRFVEFVPREDTPTRDEVLSWIWVIRPDLTEDISKVASPALADLVRFYQNGRLDEWWQRWPR